MVRKDQIMNTSTPESTTTVRSITSYQLLDHGIDGAQYFPGCGVYGTDYDYVVTGNGDTPIEAINDALESMAQSEECYDVDLDAFERQMLADESLTRWPGTPSAIENARRMNGQMSDEEWEQESDECDVYYYVSIRYCVGKVQA